MRAQCVSLGCMLVSVLAMAGPANAGVSIEVPLASPQAATNVSCTYEAGVTGDVAAIHVNDPAGVTADGRIDVGGCTWRVDQIGFVPALADVTLVDSVFGGPDVGALVCTDINDDSLFCDTSIGEAAIPICGSGSDLPVGPPFAPDPIVIAVFLNGPLHQLAHCPTLNVLGATSGQVFAAFRTPDPPGCNFSTRTIHATIETVGAGWGTKVGLTMSYLFGCDGGPVVFDGLGFCLTPFYFDNTGCVSDPPAGDGLGLTGTFQCNTPATCGGNDHSLTEQIAVDNNGAFACIAMVPMAAPDSNHHCHIH